MIITTELILKLQIYVNDDNTPVNDVLNHVYENIDINIDETKYAILELEARKY